jgi:hypothetical protein
VTGCESSGFGLSEPFDRSQTWVSATSGPQSPRLRSSVRDPPQWRAVRECPRVAPVIRSDVYVSFCVDIQVQYWMIWGDCGTCRRRPTSMVKVKCNQAEDQRSGTPAISLVSRDTTVPERNHVTARRNFDLRSKIWLVGWQKIEWFIWYDPNARWMVHVVWS